MAIRLSAKEFTIFLAVVTAVLLALNVLSILPMAWGRQDPYALFNFDYENNVPTLFSTLLLLCCSFVTLIIGYCESSKWMFQVQWFGLSLVFFLMGVDEFVQIHERLTEPTRDALNTSSFLYFAWVLPYAAILILLAVAYAPFVSKLPRDISKPLILSSGIYLCGAIGMETIGAAWYETHRRDIVFLVIASIEELLEMIGLIAFIHTFLRYIIRYLPALRLSIQS